MSSLTIPIKQYLPEKVQEIKEIGTVAKVYDDNLSKLWGVFDGIYANKFLDSLDAYGCERHEKILGIVPEAGDTLVDRRRRIKGYYSSNLPYTVPKLKEVLNSMCGVDRYELYIDRELGIVTVGVKLESRNLVGNVAEIVRRMIPADMMMEVFLEYNQNYAFKKYTHGELKKYTHYQLRNNVQFQEE